MSPSCKKDLTSCWDSYASSEASLAVRVVQANHRQGRPATIAHIQNVISDIFSVEQAAWIVFSAAQQALPDLWEHLDLTGEQVMRIDCTDGLYCENAAQAQQVIDRCRRG